MIELPEALVLANQLDKAVKGKKVERILPPTKEHKFCWFNGEPADYEAMVKGSGVEAAAGFGIYVELQFENGCRLCINDGVNVRLVSADSLPKEYQLVILFTDRTALSFSVQMYGGIVLCQGEFDNEYYVRSKQAVSPFSEEFRLLYEERLAENKPSLSAKAFLATQQRFPGVGNGVLQDILFEAGIHPKRKLETLSEEDRRHLFDSVVKVLHTMQEQGGRDTEKDIYGNWGRYVTKMSKKTVASGCPNCKGAITKEAYLGGSVYYCPNCQPLIK